MNSRRVFIKTISLTAGALALNLQKLSSRSHNGSYFALNNFIEDHPDAVFILRTTVDTKTNASVIRDVGHQLGQTLFIPQTESGFPLTTNVVIKPNLTTWSWDKTPIETTMGIHTDVNFVEGVINSIKNLGVAGSSVYIRESNYSSSRADGKLYYDMAELTGIDLKEFATIDQLSESDIQWTDVPNGVWFKRIPYLWPVNSPNSCLINISKLKSHSMGMTLCSKNLQGTIARPYVAHCSSWGQAMSGVDPNDVITGAFDTIQQNFDQHVLASIPRWEKSGTDASSGLGMETHSSRCLDNNTVLKPLINIIEGIYGREGPFVSGPADNGGYGKDIMVNFVIFGKNALHVDIIGTYLAGHNPGNFGFFHMALERGLSRYLDPEMIPLYEWNLDGSASLTSLDNFSQVAIRTLYLQKAGEDQYHMVNEPFDYPMLVELVSFIGIVVGMKVELFWKTVTEKNNFGFEVERYIIDGWIKVGFVPGRGTINSPAEYTFTDQFLAPGVYSYRLKQIDNDGHFNYSQEVEVEIDISPKEFAIEQNYPNPFNPSTTIDYQIPSDGFVDVKVFDALGREITTLVKEYKAAGKYSVLFDGKNRPSGVYFYSIHSGSFNGVKKMILLK